jgi:hypothetical protein
MKTPEGYEKADIDKYLVLIDAFVLKPTTMGFGKSGAPDRVCCIHGRFWGIEVKREGKGPTPIQTNRMNEIKKAGGLAVAGTAKIVITAIEKWRRQNHIVIETTAAGFENWLPK